VNDSSPRADNLRAIAAMLAAVGAFAIMDAAMKRLAADLAPAQVTFLRAAASIPFVLAPLLWIGAWQELRPRRPGLYAVRALLGLGMLLSFVYAISHASLADTYAVYLGAPLLVTALAVPILGERVPLRRWLAVGAGLAGVLIVLRPTGETLVTLGGLAAVVSALCYSLNVLTIRVLGRTESSRAMVLWFLVPVALVAGALAVPGWRPIRPEHWGWIALIGLTGAVAQYLITDAFRRAAPSVVAPFEYTAILWAIALDWVLWSVLPGSAVVAGAAIVVASGLYVLYDERRAAYARVSREIT
jgi:drug/metabolite transporter (DMT)-like permease